MRACMHAGVWCGDDVVQFWRAAYPWETDAEVQLSWHVWWRRAGPRLCVWLTASEPFRHQQILSHKSTYRGQTLSQNSFHSLWFSDLCMNPFPQQFGGGWRKNKASGHFPGFGSLLWVDCAAEDHQAWKDLCHLSPKIATGRMRPVCRKNIGQTRIVHGLGRPAGCFGLVQVGSGWKFYTFYIHVNCFDSMFFITDCLHSASQMMWCHFLFM